MARSPGATRYDSPRGRSRGEPIAHRGQRGPIMHVTSMKAAATVLEGCHERIELAPSEQIGRRQRGLHAADALDQPLQVPQLAEQLLSALQRRQIGALPDARGLGAKL